MTAATKYETRVTRLTINPVNEPLFVETATHVEIEDESAGEFVQLVQYADYSKDGQIRFNPDEWPHIKAAVERILKEIRTTPDK